MYAKYLLILQALILCIVHSQDLSDTLACLSSYIETFRPHLDSKLFSMFKESYPNTLSTTVKHFDLTPGSESTYIITGDIEAMWLRDSTNQFLPYMKITEECPKIRSLARGLINTQAEMIMIDSYTNAFKKFQQNIVNRHFYLSDTTQTLFMGIPVDLCRHREFATKSIWERKFEIDSLASFLRLAYEYEQRYKSIDFVSIRFIRALVRIMSTTDQQLKDQYYEKQIGKNFYTFYRNPQELREGKMRPSFGTGMLKTAFRPSDDATDLPYNIPGNAMFSTYLELVAKQILDKIAPSSVFSSEARILSIKMKRHAQSIKAAIFKYGVVSVNGRNGKILAYEVNGKGDSKTFDDANLPSLLSLPYLQFIDKNNQLYKNTREHLLSKENPYYYQMGNIKGIGSSHTPVNTIWPLALITQILTTSDKQEIKNCLEALKAHSMDNLNHESFQVGAPTIITRSWFAWANSFFGQMIITLYHNNPQVLK